jgi:hypothetical protein
MDIQLVLAKDNDYDYALRIHSLTYREMVIRQFGSWDDSVQKQYFTKS